jgi:quercetin 2,3-dioxygenase
MRIGKIWVDILDLRFVKGNLGFWGKLINMTTKNCIQDVSNLPSAGPFQTPDPFLFCVYHKDDYPAGNAKMEAPRVGNGADFDPSAPYRMYHGDRVPGFPQHPHRGFETLTAVVTGLVDHTDSMKNAGRYGHGDLQWMTAGKGIVHGEIFPLVNSDKPNPLRLFQIWLNLPSKDKMVEPHFVMHWAERIPKWSSSSESEAAPATDGARMTLWAGKYADKQGLAPPPHSWASDPKNEVTVMHIEIKKGGKFTLPAATHGSEINRSLYWIEGDSLTIGTKKVSKHAMLVLDASVEADFGNMSSTDAVTELLVLQGRPIGEPVAQHGPFVMNTQMEIRQAFSDYQATQFGGWPWPEDAVVFPKDKGRFALQKGQEERP